MIKKIIAVIAALTMCLPMIAHADTEYSYGDAVLNADSGIITIGGFDVLSSETKAVILAGYDERGILVGSQYLVLENGVCSGHAINGAAKYKMTRITNFESDFIELNVITENTAPAASEAPIASKAPTATAEPEDTTYPSLAATPPPPPYERSLDSYYTFSVITKISTATGDDGPEYLVDVLREGGEETLHVPTDAQIVVSSDYYPDMVGSDASALREGDIVYFERNNAGTLIKSMAFIHRPVDEDIMTSSENYGTDFERLFSAKGRVYGTPAREPGAVMHYGRSLSRDRYQYAYGAVLDRGSGYFTLVNRSGVIDNAIEIATTKDTIVYTCDMAVRRDRFAIGNTASITKSDIPRTEYTDDGVITFSDEWDYTYAFARVINGIATEVVIYTGLGE